MHKNDVNRLEIENSAFEGDCLIADYHEGEKELGIALLNKKNKGVINILSRSEVFQLVNFLGQFLIKTGNEVEEL